MHQTIYSPEKYGKSRGKNLLLKKQSQKTDLIFKAVTAACATLVLVIIAGIFVELFRNSQAAFAEFGLNFVISDQWNHTNQEFGALPAIYVLSSPHLLQS